MKLYGVSGGERRGSECVCIKNRKQRKRLPRHCLWIKQPSVFCNLLSVNLYPRPRIVFLEKKLPGWAVRLFWREKLTAVGYFWLAFALFSLKVPQIPATAGFSRKSLGRNDGCGGKQRGATVHCALATCTARSSSCDLLLATANLFATCHLRLATAYLPATPSTTRPARKSSGSAKAGASSCTPVGRPSTRPPLGRASAGRPARLAETVKRSAA